MSSACRQLHANLLAAALLWTTRSCSTVSSCGRARRAAFAALGRFGGIWSGVRPGLIKNVRPCNLMAPPSPLASPLRYRRVTGSPLLSPRAHSGRPRRRRSARPFAYNHSWKPPLPPPVACLLDRLLPLGLQRCAQILGLLGGGSCCTLSTRLCTGAAAALVKAVRQILGGFRRPG